MDDYSQREWERFALNEGGIGTCVVRDDCASNGSGELSCRKGERVVALCQMSLSQEAPQGNEYLWLGLIATKNAYFDQPLATPGVLPETAKESAKIEPLQSLLVVPGKRLVRFPAQRDPNALTAPDDPVNSLEASEMKHDVQEHIEPCTPRASSGPRPHAYQRQHTPVSGELPRSEPPATEIAGLGPAIELETSPAKAISQDLDARSATTPTKSKYRPQSARTSMAPRQALDAMDDDEVWDGFSSRRDPTISIYEAYFRPSMYASNEQLDPIDQSAVFMPPSRTQFEPPSESEATFDVSLESGSSMGSTRGVDAILPPVQGTAPNRLLNMSMGSHNTSLDDSSSKASSQHLSMMTRSQSDMGVPVAALDNLHLAHQAESRTPWRSSANGSYFSSQDGIISSGSRPGSQSEGYTGARSGSDTPWTPSSSDSPHGPTMLTTSPSRNLMGTSPQKLTYRLQRNSEDRYDPRSLPASKSASSLFNSPLTKRSMDLSMSPGSNDAFLFQRWTTLLTDRNGGSRTQKKARQLVEIGVPPALRGRVWLLLAEKALRPQPGVFEERCRVSQESLANVSQYPFAQLIEQDLDQCFPLTKPFAGLDGSTRDDIRRVLHAYAYHNSDVGYTEGMCLIVGLLLTHVRVEDAFWLLDAIVVRYGMQSCYVGNLSQLHVDNLVVDELLRLADEAVHQRLQDMRIEPIMFLPGWILPLFVRTLPWPTLLRVWDLFLSHGYPYLIRTAVAVICHSRATLLNARFSPGRAETLRQLVFVASPPLTPENILGCARDLPLSDKELNKMQRNAAKLVREKEKSTASMTEGGDARPAALQGKPVSRRTMRLLTGRKKSQT